MPKLGKRLRQAYEGHSRFEAQKLESAVEFVKQNAKTKFDETVDVAINLELDTRKADQNVRGMIELPHGIGKVFRIAVFAKGEQAKKAKEAGADIVGDEDLVESIQKGEINFDRCVATPDMMPLVGRLGKILGPKGIMPNPKLGTVTVNVAEAVKSLKSGAVEFRAEKNGIIHAGIGKTSFSKEKLVGNLMALFDAVIKAKPAGAKGRYIKKINLSSTMGPSVRVDLQGIDGSAS